MGLEELRPSAVRYTLRSGSSVAVFAAGVWLGVVSAGWMRTGGF